ncbi:MAG: N-acetyl-gamma-glutamyl-phosphate reductase [Candidatus Omnitrophica bacterium]|nr:N-acetyl-gamma-glutamyl-phosphate reductase [Candidatus Omnitrophota bacterium]
MKRIGIVGISGYSGMTVLKILFNHPQVRVTYVSANNTQGKLTDIWPQFQGLTKLTCSKYDIKEALKLTDLVFLAVPHTVAMQITPELLKQGKKVIDLSADYRLNNKQDYKKWYNMEHQDLKNLKKAVYGLPELYREDIKKADLIANPGCYPTAAILSLAPLVSLHAQLINSIIIDAKSGVSGAGRKATLNFSFCELTENFKAYKILNHQHTPEIELYLKKLNKISPIIHFVPHLLPIERGIFETIYIQLKEKISLHKIHAIYKKFYKTEKFVRVLDLNQQPQLKNVAHTNYCDIGLSLDQTKQMLVITSAIDNLVKGAAGQAVQNMNIMLGYPEEEGLL